MGRRRAGARFVPGCYVFPGGAVDPADRNARPATRLDPRIVGKLAVANSAQRAQALAMAAVRETYEETGLLVGKAATAETADHPAWRPFVDAGLAPALGLLSYVGRAITPTSNRRIRFHARFFRVDEQYVSGVLAGDGELEDLRWVATTDLADLPLVDVTEFMLAEVLDGKRSGQCGKPLHGYRNGVPWIRYL